MLVDNRIRDFVTLFLKRVAKNRFIIWVDKKSNVFYGITLLRLEI